MSVLDIATEHRLRAAAFAYLSALEDRVGTPIIRREDLTDFRFEGEPIRLIAVQSGIWRPKRLEAALSFLTTYVSDPSRRPYDDEDGLDGYLCYKWQYKGPTDPANYLRSDNRAMRTAMERKLPLIWFQGGGAEPLFACVSGADRRRGARVFAVHRRPRRSIAAPSARPRI